MAYEHLGTDLAIVHGHEATSAVQLDTVTEVGVDGQWAVDLTVRVGRDNLAQAIWLRLATARGELAHLGHARFGSRLHLLIGRLNNAATWRLAKAYVLEALRQERRIQRVETLEVLQHPSDRSSILINLRVIPADSDLPMEVPISMNLDGVAASSSQGGGG